MSVACGTQPAGRVGAGVGDGVAEADRSPAEGVVDDVAVGVGLAVLSVAVALGVVLGDGDMGDEAAVGRVP